MKQIQKQEYQKKPASKAKLKRKFSRQEQIDHTPERKASFRRRWGKTTIAERKALNEIYPGRNSFTVFLPNIGLTSNKSLFDLKNINYYIYKYNLETKTRNRLSTKNIDAAKQIAQLFTNDLRRKIPTHLQTQPILYGQSPGNGYAVLNKTHKEARERYRRWKRMSENEAPSKPQSTKILKPNALVGKAKRIWEDAQNNRISLFRAKKELGEFKKYYPEGLDNFNAWYQSPDGLQFRKWITQ